MDLQRQLRPGRQLERLLRDAGIITFADTFDLATGELISSEVTVVKGPHPELDSDFEAFCDVVTEALANPYRRKSILRDLKVLYDA